MNRRSTFVATLVVTLAITAGASADENQNARGNHHLFRAFTEKFSNSQNSGGSFARNADLWSDISGIASRFKKLHDHKPPETTNPTPIDPGRGDDRVPVDPVVPQGRPGYVWVNDHWERERANQPTGPVIVDPTLVGPVVRDHRTPRPANNVPWGTSAPIVRDHRSDAPTTPWNTGTPVVRDHRDGAAGGAGPVVRDHRTKSTSTGASGGVTVTGANPGSARPTSRGGRSVTIKIWNPLSLLP
ncbi:MAG: YXWGXW repeat-containing protein [Pirellulales bacterium]|nr:YXWGXW repeat-containing protein [Pirellulales bacterium]